jgi:hypothetical protein
MYNGRSHTTNQNGAAAKTKPVDKSKVIIYITVFEYIHSIYLYFRH